MDATQQFEADFNSIEHLLRMALQIETFMPFTQLVRKYAEEHPRWKDADFLRRIARIRNVIIHEKREPYCHAVIPTPAIAEELRRCKERLLNPARALPTFERTVETINLDDSLTQVLSLVHQRDYSQFPVYEEGRFKGLLTENGVTRWLAMCAAKSRFAVQLDGIAVSHVLNIDAQRENFQVVSSDTPVDDVATQFAKFPLLEAVLVTANGKDTEELLGIATRWDVLHLS
jgi:predicted transcriptional regulator